MTSTIIEEIRSNLEEKEIFEKAICQCLLQIDEKVQILHNLSYLCIFQPKERILLEHKIKILLEKVQKCSLNVLALQKDKNGLKQQEMEYLNG